MKDPKFDAEKAEFIQSVKALYIPFSLFLACVIMAAGSFLVYNQEPLGWYFIAVAGVTMISAFVALIRFQNKLRAKGIMPVEENDLPETSPFNAEARLESNQQELNKLIR
jgi:hypothetical protein